MKNLSPSVCHSDDCKEEESLAKCYGLTVQYHSERLCLEESPTKRAHCMRSLTLVRDDITITLNKTERSEEFSTKWCHSDDRREEESLAMCWSSYDAMSFWKALPWRISYQASILYEISHFRSRWHRDSLSGYRPRKRCHSERSASEMKNLLQSGNMGFLACARNDKEINNKQKTR